MKETWLRTGLYRFFQLSLRFFRILFIRNIRPVERGRDLEAIKTLQEWTMSSLPKPPTLSLFPKVSAKVNGHIMARKNDTKVGIYHLRATEKRTTFT